MVYIYNLYLLDFRRPNLSYFIDGGTDRFVVELVVGIISIKFFMRTILTETFHWIFLSGYSNGKHLHDNFV